MRCNENAWHSTDPSNFRSRVKREAFTQGPRRQAPNNRNLPGTRELGSSRTSQRRGTDRLRLFGTNTEDSSEKCCGNRQYSGNHKDGLLLCDQIRRIETREKTEKRLTLQTGDVLFNWRNFAELIGKSVIFEEQEVPHVFASFISRIKCEEIPQFFPCLFYESLSEKGSVHSTHAGQSTRQTTTAMRPWCSRFFCQHIRNSGKSLTRFE
jgi:hypothetical protein